MRNLLRYPLYAALLAVPMMTVACAKEPASAPAPSPSATEPPSGNADVAPPTTTPAAPATTPPAATPPAAGTPAAATDATSLVGKPAPAFALKDLDGKEVSLASLQGKTVVLEWFNPQCPYVKKSHSVGSLVGTAKKHTDAGVVWLAINSGAPGKQGNDPAVNVAAVKEWQLPHPVLRDEDGVVGKAYGATNTPHLYVIDSKGNVAYAGAIDNSPDAEGASPEGGKLINYVDAALGDLAAGKPVAVPSTKAYGCSVKYAS